MSVANRVRDTCAPSCINMIPKNQNGAARPQHRGHESPHTYRLTHTTQHNHTRVQRHPHILVSTAGCGDFLNHTRYSLLWWRIMIDWLEPDLRQTE